MTNVAGIFDNAIHANSALSSLLDADFKKEDISIIVSDNVKHVIFPAPVDDESTRSTKGGAAGALFGGAAGALIAGLTAVGSIAIPGLGLAVAGPMIAILAGAGTGAAIGGLSGALISAGFAVDEAKKYEEEVKAGKAVVIVYTNDELAPKARSILNREEGFVKVA